MDMEMLFKLSSFFLFRYFEGLVRSLVVFNFFLHSTVLHDIPYVLGCLDNGQVLNSLENGFSLHLGRTTIESNNYFDFAPLNLGRSSVATLKCWCASSIHGRCDNDDRRNLKREYQKIKLLAIADDPTIPRLPGLINKVI